MRWKGRRQSENVEDRRGSRAPAAAGLGLGAILIAILAMFLGQDPQKVLGELGAQQQAGAGRSTGASEPGQPLPDDEIVAFLSTVLAETEDTWTRLFQQEGLQYREPVLVPFYDQVTSACGAQSAQVGPFYCPADSKIYIDTSFFSDLKTRHGAPGDFAQAYVLAHEVGHHVQNLLGISTKIHQQRRRVSKTEANDLSVRMELQADFLAGVWAHNADRMEGLLQAGDLEEALRAATAIGDDRLQREAGRAVVPESFTHGTSAQRVRWFRKGFMTGSLAEMDTFSARDL